MPGGRPRNLKKAYPAHIDPKKLPDRVYWHARYSYWYVKWLDETGRWRTKRVAGKHARLYELHEIAELQKGVQRGTFDYIAQKFAGHADYKGLAKGTRHTYDYARGLVSKHPTRSGTPLGEAPLSKWKPSTAQKLIDKIAETNGPSSAAHTLRYLRRLFRWAVNRDYAASNPAQSVEPPKERKRQRLPEQAAYDAVLQFAKAYTSAPYLWIVMELALHMRLRGIEVITLTDANELEEGALTNRRKGSRDSIIKWGPALREAWDAAKANRQAVWEKRRAPVPLKAEDRPLLISARGGCPLKKSSLDSAWQRMIKKAITEGAITDEQRFSPHDIKRFAITHTEGGWDAKREAGGHKSDAMRAVYDKSVPVVDEVKKGKKEV